MEAVQRYVTQTLPRYLKSLPIPKDVNGFSTLSHDEWMKLIPFFAVITTLIVVLLTSLFTDPSKKWKDEVERLTKELNSQRVNTTIKMNEAKVVDTCQFKDIEDCDQKVFCRCWKSSKFPYCDGSHNNHNNSARDNVGPLIVKGGKAQ